MSKLIKNNAKSAKNTETESSDFSQSRTLNLDMTKKSLQENKAQESVGMLKSAK
jgi:hypothetical protein